MVLDFGDINGGFTPPLSFGRLGAPGNVKPENMPDNVSRQIELKRIVEASSFPDEDAMTKVVAHTCTAEFHKRKGYLDSEEQSALTFRELEKLFDIHFPDKPINPAYILIEHEDTPTCTRPCTSSWGTSPSWTSATLPPLFHAFWTAF